MLNKEILIHPGLKKGGGIQTTMLSRARWPSVKRPVTSLATRTWHTLSVIRKLKQISWLPDKNHRRGPYSETLQDHQS